MLDTLMVLWTRGLCGRFFQALATFVCLFIGICVLLFLVTASGVKWSGLAVTVTPSDVSATQPVPPTPTATRFILPIILQNPTPALAPRRPFRRYPFRYPIVTPTPVFPVQPGN